MTPAEMDDYVKFIVGTIPLLMKPGDTLTDELNLQPNGQGLQSRGQ